MGRNTNQKAKEGMINQGKIGDSKVFDGGEERSNNEDIINHAHTPIVRPTCKKIRIQKVREAIQNYKVRGPTELEVAIIEN